MALEQAGPKDVVTKRCSCRQIILSKTVAARPVIRLFWGQKVKKILDRCCVLIGNSACYVPLKTSY